VLTNATNLVSVHIDSQIDQMNALEISSCDPTVSVLAEALGMDETMVKLMLYAVDDDDDDSFSDEDDDDEEEDDE